MRRMLMVILGSLIPLAAGGSDASAINNREYDVVVVGGTPGGIACAVRAAREGLTVLLTQHNKHVGGMMTNGLTQWDALYAGHRAPLFSELIRNIENHYRTTYGEGSVDFQKVKFTQQHYPIGTVEPHIAEREFNRLLAGEGPKLSVLLGYYPIAVERAGSRLGRLTLRESGGQQEVRVSAAIYADATYEGDLFALAQVPYRVGREARDEYNEPHAGKIFTNIARGPAPKDAVEGRLNIHPYSLKQGSIDPNSPFTADRCIQAYNVRFSVTNDPANRLPIPKPRNYNREEYLKYERKYIAREIGPNHKGHVNSPILPGENHDYPEADWPTREKIYQRHLEFGLGLMWFLQNDESVPEAQRRGYQQWGLPKDEFADNGHVPYEMYVREARRIVGRYVFTEHDNSLSPDYARTPIHPDSIGITDWYMDSHACTKESRPGYKYDGKLILTEESRPAQIPYRSLIPQGVDNLLVPVCLSATHVAWGAIRLEPVMLQVGESAGFAAALARQSGRSPAAIDPPALIRRLCDAKVMVTFFNDVNVAEDDPSIRAAQFLGTRGFFASYDARLQRPLTRPLAEVWIRGLHDLRRQPHAVSPIGKDVKPLEAQTDAATLSLKDFLDRLAEEKLAPRDSPVLKRILETQKWDLAQTLTRGQACVIIYELAK